jgi:type I restriction enzyme R subunit
LDEVRRLPQRNFAVELLQKLLNDEIRSRSRTNVVIEKKFSERLQAALNRYRSRAIESAQVIEELIGMAKEFREAAKRGEKLGLNNSELAFYDALADNESAVRELGDEILKKIALELTEKLRNSTTVDWQKRESVRARLRNLVRITLRRYKYPPDKQDEAIRLVLEQAERLSDDWSKGTD